MCVIHIETAAYLFFFTIIRFLCKNWNFWNINKFLFFCLQIDCHDGRARVTVTAIIRWYLSTRISRGCRCRTWFCPPSSNCRRRRLRLPFRRPVARRGTLPSNSRSAARQCQARGRGRDDADSLRRAASWRRTGTSTTPSPAATAVPTSRRPLTRGNGQPSVPICETSPMTFTPRKQRYLTSQILLLLNYTTFIYHYYYCVYETLNLRQ